MEMYIECVHSTAIYFSETHGENHHMLEPYYTVHVSESEVLELRLGIAQANNGWLLYICIVDVSSELFMKKVDSSTMNAFNVSFHNIHGHSSIISTLICLTY